MKCLFTAKERRKIKRLRFNKSHPYEADFADGFYQTRRLEYEGPKLVSLMEKNKDKQALRYYEEKI